MSGVTLKCMKNTVYFDLIVITSNREVIFCLVWWLVGLWAGLQKIFRTDFNKTWMEDGSWPKIDPINFWYGSIKCFSLILTLHERQFFIIFLNFLWNNSGILLKMVHFSGWYLKGGYNLMWIVDLKKLRISSHGWLKMMNYKFDIGFDLIELKENEPCALLGAILVVHDAVKPLLSSSWQTKRDDSRNSEGSDH